MVRAILIALAGLMFFIGSLPLMMPLRMMQEPIENYNLFYVPFLVVLLLFLFHRCCTVQKQSRAFLYGFFAAQVAWQLFGEVASMPVEKGLVTQFSGMNIKLIDAYFYVIGGWVGLLVLWRTQAIKNAVAVFLLTFLSIWSFELYMDNYSSRIAVAMMPLVGRSIGTIAAVVSVVLLVRARRAARVETQTVLGCVLYITLSLVLMGFGPWQAPQKFYVKYEARHIADEIEQLQQEQQRVRELTRYMIDKGLLEPGEIPAPVTD